MTTPSTGATLWVVVNAAFPRSFGRYTLIANLAQGGMGALYLACQGDTGMEKLCVIKTVLPHLADKEYVARFRDEAKVVVKLSHGNDVPVFIAMQLCRGLSHAHSFLTIKLVHRDVSPPKVLLSFFGEVKLTDFGL